MVTRNACLRTSFGFEAGRQLEGVTRSPPVMGVLARAWGGSTVVNGPQRRLVSPLRGEGPANGRFLRGQLGSVEGAVTVAMVPCAGSRVDLALVSEDV